MDVEDLAEPRRLVFFGLGGVAFVIGVGLLAFGAYNAFFKGDDGPPVSDAPIIDVGSIITETPIPQIDPTPPPAPPLGDRPYTMIIDKLGVNAPVTTMGLDENAVPEIPTGDDAKDVIAWYNFSAKPGVGSNAVFAGHVTWFGEAVFYNLPNLVLQDEIKLIGEDGTELVYHVSNIFRVSASDPNARDVMLSTPTDELTIITCDGVFTPDPNDHISGGNYDNRLVVRADLVSVTPGATPAPAAAAVGN